MAKTKRQTQLETVAGDIEGALEKLEKLVDAASFDPYLTDAASFLTQAKRMVEKHVVTEFGAALPTPKPEAAKKGK
jgi:hypothetical protein